jgi:hypothetical protein
MTCTCNLAPKKLEAGGSQVQRQPGLRSETLKKNNNIK